ncbi:MAG TPA: response regulator [Verrucomicrobiae bacterium]
MARILIIDDDANLRTILGHALKAVGHEVILAADGREGIKQHRAVPADLIITDLFMPEQEGLETIRQLRKEFPEIAIIAMSGIDPTNTMLTIASKLGAARILQKPFGIERLLKTIDEVL